VARVAQQFSISARFGSWVLGLGSWVVRLPASPSRRNFFPILRVACLLDFGEKWWVFSEFFGVFDLFPPAQQARFGHFLGFGKATMRYSRGLRGFLAGIFPLKFRASGRGGGSGRRVCVVGIPRIFRGTPRLALAPRFACRVAQHFFDFPRFGPHSDSSRRPIARSGERAKVSRTTTNPFLPQAVAQLQEKL
jgi:hypothetical protein